MSLYHSSDHSVLQVLGVSFSAVKIGYSVKAGTVVFILCSSAHLALGLVQVDIEDVENGRNGWMDSGHWLLLAS